MSHRHQGAVGSRVAHWRVRVLAAVIAGHVELGCRPAVRAPEGEPQASAAAKSAVEPSAVEPSASLGIELSAKYGCLACHSLDGAERLGPSWRGLYRRPVSLTSGQTVVADERYLTESIMEPSAAIVTGYEPVMPEYWGRLRPQETAAIVELIRSLASPQ